MIYGWFRRNVGKQTSKICYDSLYIISVIYRFRQVNILCVTQLYINEQHFTAVARSSWKSTALKYCVYGWINLYLMQWNWTLGDTSYEASRSEWHSLYILFKLEFGAMYHSCLFSEHPGWSGRGVKLTTHVHLVPRLRMSEAVPLLFV
jgi:hypothetical protein